MAVLLDTSVIIYLLKQPSKIGKSAIDSINASDGFYVSVVSLWEIAIKMKIGKLSVPQPIEDIPNLLGAYELALESRHTDAYLKIDLEHKDPYDTMLLAQSVTEKMRLITTDKLLLDSPYPTLDGRV